MELSHKLALRSASTLAQPSLQYQGFTGFVRDNHLFLSGSGSGSHLHSQISILGDGSPMDRRAGCKSLRASWNEDEGSRERSTCNLYHTCQQTLEKPSLQYCSGLKVAARHACNDARIVNACAREGFGLIAQGFVRLDRRVRQDVALLGSRFLKLDARAREDTVKLDIDARRNAARLHTIAMDFKDEASAHLKTATERHWSDGALEADLRLADLRARRRAMEDAYLALQLVKSIHNGMAYWRQSELKKRTSISQESMWQSGNTLQPADPGGRLIIERLTALQDAFWDIASALAEADGIDYSDPEELELIIATLLDMDAVDGASSATMLAECAKSPDVATRQALANALGNAPSLWALGNAGMGALQRLTEDVNAAVASAASKALEELRKQWQMESSKESLLFQADDGNVLERSYPSEDADDKD